MQQPQASITLSKVRGNQISMMGRAARPGRYLLEAATMRTSEILTTADGIALGSSDTVILMGTGDKPMREEIDIAGLFLDDRLIDDFNIVDKHNRDAIDQAQRCHRQPGS